LNAEQSPGEDQARSQEMPSEEEIRARLEEELKKVSVRDVLLQSAVTLLNLGGQRLGLTPSSRDSRNLDDSRVAIEALRALVPLLEKQDPAEVRPLRDALAQLQMAYAHEAQAAGAAGESGPQGQTPPPPGQARPAAAPPAGGGQPEGGRRPPSRGGLWVPGRGDG
jgi:hypothetical protein